MTTQSGDLDPPGLPAERSGWHRLVRAVPAGWYVAIVIVVGVIAVILPNPSRAVRVSALAAIGSSSDIAVLGPSVVRHTSICDRDSRQLPDMLADSSGGTVTDLSYPGEPFTVAVYLAALEATYGRSTDIVLVTTYDGFVEWPTLPYRETLFFALLNPSFGAPIDLGWAGAWQGLLDRPHASNLGFEYDGVVYPNQRGIHAKWFEAEKAQQTCPETVTHDWTYLKAYTWFLRIQSEPHPAMLSIVAALNAHVSARGKTLHVVMLPVNYELLGGFDPSWPTLVRERERWKREALTRLGIKVLDLSELSPAEDFSTVWCACTHFNETGRRKVAEAIARHLSSPAPAEATAIAKERATGEPSELTD